jgi:hypothetical protein
VPGRDRGASSLNERNPVRAIAESALASGVSMALLR